MEDHYGRSSFGFEENIVAAASYFFMGPFIYVKEKRSEYVRFHSLQATIAYLFLLIYWLAVKFIPGLGFLRLTPGLFALCLTAFMMVKAYDGVEFKLPLIGKLAFRVVYECNEDILAHAEAEAAAKAEAEKQRASKLKNKK